MIEYVTVMGPGLPWALYYSARVAQSYDGFCAEFVRVEMRINGHWFRPPVGIRAGKAQGSGQ